MQSSQSRPTAVTETRDASAGQRAYAVLRNFSIVSFIAIGVATVVLTMLQQRLAVQDLLEAQEQHHIALTRIVARSQWPAFSAFFHVASTTKNEALRAHPKLVDLRQLVQQELAGTQILKVKSYDLAGRTVFSTETKQIGEDKSTNAGFLSARAGVPISELTHRDQFSAFEQTVENIDVVSSYVPVFKKDSRDIDAVFEVYSDISPLLQRITDTRNTVGLQVMATLLGLYLVLMFVVRRADARIKTQEIQHQRDENSLRAAREQVVRSEQFHRALIEQSSDAVLLLGQDLKVRYTTPADVRVLGVPEASLIGFALPAYACEEYRKAVADWLDQIGTHPDGVEPIEFEANHATEGRRHFLATATNLYGHPVIQGIVINIRDITERKQAELQVRHHAFYDGLTGLARREFFVTQLHKAIAHAARHKLGLGIMFLDLDGFKDVNDTLGHAAGDQLLKEVGARLRFTLREDDTIGRGGLTDDEDRIARLGGDEFTILLSRLDQPASARLVALRMLDAVSSPYRVNDREIVVTTSIGIALYPQDGDDSDALLKCADAAMYIAKQQGKNTYRFHSEP